MILQLLVVLQYLLYIVWWVIIVQAVLSWLIAFNVINTSNEGVRTIWTALQRITEPVYRPIRRVLPDFGALDLSPLVVLLIIGLLDRMLTIAIAQQAVGVIATS